MFAGLWPAKSFLTSRERRRAPRYSGKLPVKLERGWGVTRDFSSVGIFFETDQSFSVGEIIGLVLEIIHSDLGRSFRIRFQGIVLRVEPSGEKVGVSVAIRSYAFEGLQEPEKA